MAAGAARMDAMVRPARTSDAKAISALVNHYAERGRMLHRSLESVYESLRDFLVASDDAALAGCVALSISDRDLAEIRSLAVAGQCRGRGVGSRLVEAAVGQARQLGLARIFVLTCEPDFFSRFRFHLVERDSLPAKVWRDCIHCPRADDCNEIAMVLDLEAANG